ncbi:MAG: sigma-E processing peptidase SpoIIGA [Clostridia bacterium]|nr:sigma-E processing peptidase SpoIIGA [Clostridia bacterium]
MRVNGEAFFLINFWMDFLSLLLTACLGKARFFPGRAAVASALGGAYALTAWGALPMLRRLPVLAAAALMMGGVTFGRRAALLCPLLLAAGMFLTGLCDVLLARHVPPGGAMLLCGGCVLVLTRLPRHGTPHRRDLALRVIYRGQAVTLPALRDSGNLLTDWATGLPVIVAPARAVKPLLPEGVDPGDPATLAPGFRLMGLRTAAGEGTVMCFHPDRVVLAGREADAILALSNRPLPRALVPDGFFSQEEGCTHAGF